MWVAGPNDLGYHHRFPQGAHQCLFWSRELGLNTSTPVKAVDVLTRPTAHLYSYFNLNFW